MCMSREKIVNLAPISDDGEKIQNTCWRYTCVDLKIKEAGNHVSYT